MNWTDWAYLPLMLTVAVAWTICLAAGSYFRAWVLIFILQGVAAAGAVTYAATGDWGSAAAAGGMVALTWFIRWLWKPDGPRKSLRGGRGTRR